MEQKNGAVVRRLVGYGHFDGIEAARVMARLYTPARLHVNFFQPSFKRKETRREGAKVIKRYHQPATPYERPLAHPKTYTSDQASSARDIPHSRSRATVGRDPCGAGGTLRADRQAQSRDSSRPRLAGRSAVVCSIARTRRPRLPKCEPHITDRNGDTRNAFACPRSSIRIKRRSRTGSPSSRNSLR